MSGALKSVGKVFKKVTNTVAKVAPIALGVGALVFTAGSALGALPSWGSAVGSVFGTDSLLGRTLTGAVTQAGYGSVLGMGTSLLTGGDVVKGAQYGSAAGGAVGGVMGATGYGTDILDSGQQPSTAAQPGLSAPAIRSSVVGPLNGGATVSGAAPALNVMSQAAPALGGATRTGFFSGDGGAVLGNVIAGAAQGWMQGLSAKDSADAALKRDQAERAAIAANYGNGRVGLLTAQDVAGLPNNAANPDPASKFDPAAGYGGYWSYNPQLGRIVKVTPQQQVA